MRPDHTRSPALIGALPMPQDARMHLLRNALIVLAGTALLALSARIQVPMWPVPMTMQSLTVLLIGMSLGARLGSITLLAYLAQGALGLPVFASGGGIAYLVGPTAGYLYGFAAAAMITGWLADRGWTTGFVRAFAAALLGGAVIHALGAGWLAQFVGFERAVTLGMLPFAAGDLVKCALAALLLPSAWAILRATR